MTSNANPSGRTALVKRLLRDQAGSVLPMVAAAVFPVIAMVGGAVDMSRGYMAKARMQQACDAGSLAARRAMNSDTLTTANKAVGYKYFDFNFPAELYGVDNLVRTYSQPISNLGVPQPVVNGSATAAVPTTLMQVFGKDSISLEVQCASRKDVAHADVSMVLDVTGSMAASMDKAAPAGGATETRIVALRRAVRAFYDALGPGRAGGDTTKGRIRYAFAPYGTVVNAGYLLNNSQMVDSHTYSSRGPISSNLYSWTEGAVVNGSFTASTPASIPASAVTAASVPGNYNTFSTGSGPGPVGTDNTAPYATVTYTKLDGSSATVSKTITQVPRAAPATGTETATSANCYRANLLAPVNNGTNPGLFDAMQNTTGSTTSETSSSVTTPAPVWPQSSRQKTNVTQTTTNRTNALRYKWLNVSGTSLCRLESATGRTATNWTQTRTGTGQAPITWTTHGSGTGRFAYHPRTISVSALKAGGSSWNQTLNVPNLNVSGGTWTAVKLSGNDKLPGSTTDNVTYVGTGVTGSTASVTWRGCVEERRMDNTITATSALSPLTANSMDLDVTVPASTTNDDTRWRPWLNGAFFSPAGTGSSDECPSPALKLQEIASYNNTVITTNYPMLFDATSGGTSSYYYPYSSTAANNVATVKNYIDRIQLTDGTLHDSGFIWGFHLLSGQGMFASENPDFLEGTIVSRNLVFMTDGEMNPGEERYVFSGHNYVDGRLAPRTTTNSGMKAIENRRLRMMCEAAKEQGITVWVVVINDTPQDYSDLLACATSDSHYKSAKTADELVASFTTIAQSIGGLRLSQ